MNSKSSMLVHFSAPLRAAAICAPSRWLRHLSPSRACRQHPHATSSYPRRIRQRIPLRAASGIAGPIPEHRRSDDKLHPASSTPMGSSTATASAPSSSATSAARAQAPTTTASTSSSGSGSDAGPPDTSDITAGSSAPAGNGAAAGGKELATRKARKGQQRTRQKDCAPGPNIAKFVDQALLIDKPVGWTSHDVCAKVRGMLRIKRVGHAGTLDPMATGLLVLCTGKATKQVNDFMGMDKWYSGTLLLGEGTASYDSELEVTERLPWEHITDAELQAAAMKLSGAQMQVPPMFSAIKQGGQALYHLAREGIEVHRDVRPVTIHAFHVQRGTGAALGGDSAEAAPASVPGVPEQTVHFSVHCSKGTYIRSLVYDLGRELGSVAHMTTLRRDAIGDLKLQAAWQLPELVDAITAARAADMALAAAEEEGGSSRGGA